MRRYSPKREQGASPAGNSRSDAAPWLHPGPDGDKLEMEDFPSFLLSRLGSLAKVKLTRHYLDDAGLSLPEWRLLTIMARFSPTTYSAIVQRSSMDKGQISLTLRMLVARGWATWTEEAAAKERPQGRVRCIVTITAAGRKVIDGILPDARRVQMRLLAQLPQHERVELYRLLRKTLTALEEMAPAAGAGSSSV